MKIDGVRQDLKQEIADVRVGLTVRMDRVEQKRGRFRFRILHPHSQR